MITVGAEAPDFTLPGTTGDRSGRHEYTLSGLRGQPVVLVFYPADSSPVCTVQLNSYTEDISQFEAVGARVLAISPQGLDDHERFAGEEGGFAFPLLADEDMAVGEAFEILGPLGFYRRSVFVVDPEGLIRYAHRSTAGMTFRPTSEIVSAVATFAT